MSRISLYKILIINFFLLLFFSFQNVLFAFEQNIIQYPDKNSNESPTLTQHYKGTNSKALIIYLSGGTGMHTANAFLVPFIDLTQKNSSQGRYDLVNVVSPKPLESKILDRNWFNETYKMRSDKDHLLRIESIINYYKSKTKLPIILFGHSNGGMSIEAFLNYMIKENKTNLLNGILISESKEEILSSVISILKKPEINLPIILMNHKNTRCYGVNFNSQLREFEKYKEIKKSVASIITIESGEDSTSQPCYSGYHMFALAHKEVLEKIEIELDKIKF